MSTTMNNKRKVIARTNQPVQTPVLSLIVFGLLLDRIGAPPWAWGVFGTLAVLLILAALLVRHNEKQIDVFAWDTPKLNGTGPYDRATVATEAAKERGDADSRVEVWRGIRGGPA